MACTIFVVPGFYLPPFFDGIAGWTLTSSRDSYLTKQINIVFEDEYTAWFRPSFFNPLTQDGRPLRAIMVADPIFFEGDSAFGFLLSLYSQAYPSVSQGRLPTQRWLGSVAYPPHTFDQGNFESGVYQTPSLVKRFELVELRRTAEVNDRVVIRRWDNPGD